MLRRKQSVDEKNEEIRRRISSMSHSPSPYTASNPLCSPLLLSPSPHPSSSHAADSAISFTFVSLIYFHSTRHIPPPDPSYYLPSAPQYIPRQQPSPYRSRSHEPPDRSEMDVTSEVRVQLPLNEERREMIDVLARCVVHGGSEFEV